MLHLPLLLPGPDKWWCYRLSRFGQPFGFHQEQLPIPQSKERFAALFISASTQHVDCPLARIHTDPELPDS